MKLFQEYQYRGAAAIGTVAYNYYNQHTRPKLAEKQSVSRTVVLRKRKRKSRNNNMVTQFTHVRRKFGRYKKRTVKSAHRRLDDLHEVSITRWQNVSRFGTGGGNQGIWSYGNASTPTSQHLNLHVMDLTTWGGNPLTGPLTDGMYVATVTNATGDITYTKLRSQNEAGVLGAGSFIMEYGNDYATVQDARLKWVDLKMNLYGSYSIPIKWKISLIRVHDELATFGHLSSSEHQKEMIDSMIRSYKYSNILTNTGYQKKMYTVIKEYNYVVEPLQYTDQSVVTGDPIVISPHFIEFKDFIKLDKDMNYAWHDSTTADDLTKDDPVVNTMQRNASDLHNTVYPTNRIYLVIQASSCFLNKGDGSLDPTTQIITKDMLKWAPSYDICLRRKILTGVNVV